MADKKLPQINHNEHAATISEFHAARAAQKAAAKAEREAKARADVARLKLLQAMNGHPTVRCGPSIVLTIKPGQTTAGSVTLHDGSKIPLDQIDGIAIGGGIIPMNEIKTLFGGRQTGADIEIGGNS